MHIVTENSEADFDRRQAMDQVALQLRELTANLLRVTRGAGKPHEIGQQAQELINTMVKYRNAVGQSPSNEEIAGALDVSPDENYADQISADALDQMHAKHNVVCGALQIVASRLLGQRTHETAGNQEMIQGIRELEYIAVKRSTSDGSTAAPKRPIK